VGQLARQIGLRFLGAGIYSDSSPARQIAAVKSTKTPIIFTTE
jgi:hypothetical protein